MVLLQGSGLRRRARRLGRVRWLTKRKVLRRYGASPRRWWRYVLFDPEVDSFTYAIANEDQLAAALEPVLGVPHAQLGALIAEAHEEEPLGRALRQPPSHWLWSKRQPEPRAHHLALWAAIRALRPDVVVETGILDGMASTVMLAALQRNGQGTLISFDVMPGTGAMVPAALRDRWEPVYANAPDVLGEVIGDRRIALFTSDSLPDLEQIGAEFAAVLAHADDRLVAFTAWGALDGVLGWAGTDVVRFRDRPVGHFYGGAEFAATRVR
jgi:hypothetical protein